MTPERAEELAVEASKGEHGQHDFTCDKSWLYAFVKLVERDCEKLADEQWVKNPHCSGGDAIQAGHVIA